MKTQSVRTVTTSLLASFGLLAAGAALPGRAHAAFVFTLQQTGPDVVLTGAGSFNLTALTKSAGTSGGQSGAVPNRPYLVAGPVTTTLIDIYSGATGSAIFGIGSAPILATSGTGSIAGVNFTTIVVPVGYTSGTPLADTATFANATFASLGITPGTYSLAWGSGATADSLTVNAIPEPSTYALALLGGAGLLGAVRRNRAARLRV